MKKDEMRQIRNEKDSKKRENDRSDMNGRT